MGRYEFAQSSDNPKKANKWSKRASVEINQQQQQVELQDFEHGLERSVKTKKEAKPPRVGFFELFRFADKLDYFLMLFGVAIALTHGACLQLNFYFLGNVLDKFMELSANGSCVDGSCQDEVDSFIKTLSLNFCVNALAIMTVGYLHMMCWCTTAERQVKVIRRKAFAAVLRQHMGWFDRQQSGELNTRLTNDVSNIHLGMGDKVSTFVQWMSTFIAGATICLVRAWELTLVMLAVSPLAMIVGGLVARALQTFATRELNAYATAGAVAEEVLGSIRTVTAYGGQKKEANRYNSQLQGARKVGIKRGFVNGTGQGLLWFIVFGIISLAFWYGARLVLEPGSNYSMGILMQVQYSLFTGTRAVSFSIGNLENFSMARGGAAAVYNLIDSTSEIDSSADCGDAPSAIMGDLLLDNVDFAYPTRRDIKILDGMTLSIRPGQTVALVGPSGCGKSTVVQLIQRFYDTTRGTITVDGHDLRNLNIKWLRQQIGVVSQEPVLFATTIRENIMFGREGVTQEDIERAAKEANAHNFISQLPDKYETLVGAKGAQLSGGQKQRVAIARALIRNPKILLLDDATSALDYQSESVVQEALDKARQGRTTLIVAHRLSTIRNADVICVIQNGRIVEQGSHDQLLEAGGVYHNLVSGQTGKDDVLFEESESQSGEEESESGYDEVDVEEFMAAPIVSTPKSLAGDVVSLESRTGSMRLRSGSKYSGGHARKDKKKRKKNQKSITKDDEADAIRPDKFPEASEGAPLGRILGVNKPEIPFLLLGCTAAIFQGALFPALTFFTSEILAAFSIQDKDEQQRRINEVVGILVGIGCMACLATFTMISMFTLSGERLTMRLRSMAFKAMLRQEIAWFDDKTNQVGSLTSRLATDASLVKGATGAHLSTMINASSTVVLSVLIAFWFGWKLALVACCFLPPLIGTGAVQTKVLTGFARDSKKSVEEGGKLISEAIENIRTVAALTMEDFFLERYEDHFTKSYKNGLKRAHVFGVTWGISQSVLFFAYAANYSFGAFLIGRGEMQFYNVFRVFVAISTGAIEIGRINSFASDYSKAKVSAAKLFRLFDRKSSINPENTGGTRLPSCRGEVGFHDVRFRYPTRPEVEVLRGLNVSVRPGQSLALVGSSGCGKSTTVQLLERFYDPEAGIVTVDGEDVSQLNLQWLRSQLGIVAQEPTLFEDTIRNNIAYGDQDRDVPIEEIMAAAQQANIHQFVTNLPLGYDTFVGAKGAQLVGGQKQRIAIARALIRNPKILLLDEATSALDTDNEKVVQEALDLAQKGRTSIVIAHRLSTIENADLIAVIDEGHVVELGRHSELMAQKGLYFSLQMIQKGVKT